MRRSVRGPCIQTRDRAHIPLRGILSYLRIIYPRRVCASEKTRLGAAERLGGRREAKRSGTMGGATVAARREARSGAARWEARRLQPGAHKQIEPERADAPGLDTRRLKRASISGASSPAPRPRQRPGTTRGQRRPRSSGRHRRAPRADPRNHARPRRLRFGDTHHPRAS